MYQNTERILKNINFEFENIFAFSETTAAMSIARKRPIMISSSEGYHTTTPIQNYYLLLVGELKTKA